MHTASPCQVFQPRALVSSGGTTQTPILIQAFCPFNRWWLPHLFSSGPGLTIPSGHQRVLEPRLLLRQAGFPRGWSLDQTQGHGSQQGQLIPQAAYRLDPQHGPLVGVAELQG